jgi:hypothetical protein
MHCRRSRAPKPNDAPEQPQMKASTPSPIVPLPPPENPSYRPSAPPINEVRQGHWR